MNAYHLINYQTGEVVGPFAELGAATRYRAGGRCRGEDWQIRHCSQDHAVALAWGAIQNRPHLADAYRHAYLEENAR